VCHCSGVTSLTSATCLHLPITKPVSVPHTNLTSCVCKITASYSKKLRNLTTPKIFEYNGQILVCVSHTDVHFTVSLGKAALFHRKPAPSRTSCDSYGFQGHDKIHTLYKCTKNVKCCYNTH